MRGFGNVGFDQGFGFGNFMFTSMPIIVFLGFILVFGLIIFSLIQKAKIESKNNRSPVLTVEARVVAKRTDVKHHNNTNMNDNINHHTTSTWYYVTFQVESGDRMELEVSGNEFGMLVEQDVGKLTFQGTRYLGYVRN